MKGIAASMCYVVRQPVGKGIRFAAVFSVEILMIARCVLIFVEKIVEVSGKMTHNGSGLYVVD
jgi:hypothetical protein